MSAPPSRGPRLRELGLHIGRFEAGSANAITDVFRRGTEPTKFADTVQKSTTDLFNLDQGDAAEAPIKKINPDEITD